jgi:GxxExxY protein
MIMDSERINKLCDAVRECAFDLHRYLRSGHLEKIYENGLVHRLKKRNIDVQQQSLVSVYDEDGTLLGDLCVDLLVENELIVELKATRSVSDDHVAQLLGYLCSSHKRYGLLINFGAPKLYVKRYVFDLI